MSDSRLSDLVSIGVLMKVFPPEVVDAVITECGRSEQRRRSLPARSMAYFAMGMALHADGSYEDVLALISDGIAWAQRTDGAKQQGIVDPSKKFTVSLEFMTSNGAYAQIMSAAQREAAGTGGYTDWEMAQLYQGGRLPGVTFMRGGQVVENPFGP